jgi:hypothetical protein
MNTRRFNSLSDFLDSIKDKPKGEAMTEAAEQYSIVSHLVKEIRREHKKKAIVVDPALVDYFSGLQDLLSALERPGEFAQLDDGYTKRQIEEVVKTLRQV